MIEIPLTAEDFSAIRFCTSPVGEAVLSVRVLQDPARHALYLEWIHESAAKLDSRDLAMLCRLIRPSGYIPDFLTPAPDAARPSVEDELEQVRSARAENIVNDVRELVKDGVPIAELRDFLERPRAALESFVKTLRRYWNIALERHWSYMCTVLEGDIVLRAHSLATAGPGALFGQIHPAMAFDQARCCIMVSKRVERTITPAGSGLRLIPRMFAWPDIYVLDDPFPVSIAYPPRGLALWGQVAEDTEDALAAAFGSARARVLLALKAPTHVTELATRLGVTKGAASQHLTRLSQAGLVEATRRGGYRYFYLSRRGETVVQSFGATAETRRA